MKKDIWVDYKKKLHVIPAAWLALHSISWWFKPHETHNILCNQNAPSASSSLLLICSHHHPFFFSMVATRTNTLQTWLSSYILFCWLRLVWLPRDDGGCLRRRSVCWIMAGAHRAFISAADKSSRAPLCCSAETKRDARNYTNTQDRSHLSALIRCNDTDGQQTRTHQ